MFLVKAKSFLVELKKDERGVTAIEYALVAVAIAGIVSVVFSDAGGLGEALNTAMSTITGYLD